MQEHIEEGGECTLVVNAVVNVETLVLGINEAVADVLWYPVNADGDTLEVVLYSVEHLELGLAVFVYVI